MCAEAVIEITSIAATSVVIQRKDYPTARPSAATVKQKKAERLTVKRRDGAGWVKAGKIKKVKKPWLMRVQQPR
jgi:hypothetical protein